tara:strand:- start:195 stop:431 length:237 start_codon:yes stop_codon:yes gene_type:complete
LPGKRSELTDAVLDVISEVQAIRKAAKNNAGIPLMKENIRTRDSRARFNVMSQEQRKQFIQEQGVDSVLDLMREDNGS